MCLWLFVLFAERSCHTEQRPQRCSVPQFPWCKSRDGRAPSELMVQGGWKAQGGVWSARLPWREGCPGQEGGLPASSPRPTFLMGRCWGKAQGRWEPGWDSVWGSHTRTQHCRAGGEALQRLGWDHSCMCRWPGETSLQEMLKGKLLFRHLKGCKARVKCLLDTSTGKKHPRKIQGTALLRHRIRLVTSEHHWGLALRKLSSNNICLHGTKQLISQHY